MPLLRFKHAPFGLADKQDRYHQDTILVIKIVIWYLELKKVKINKTR